jgi:hypothetical protein
MEKNFSMVVLHWATCLCRFVVSMNSSSCARSYFYCVGHRKGHFATCTQ